MTSKRRAENQELLRQDKQIDECIERKTKNWRRIIDGKLITGFDEEEDFDMKWNMRMDLRAGKKIC